MTDDAFKVKKIVQSMEQGPDATTMTLHFKVFKLRYSSQLVFENVIKACRRSVDCRPPVHLRHILDKYSHCNKKHHRCCLHNRR